MRQHACGEHLDVRRLDLTGICTRMTLSWVSTGFLHELGVTLDWPEAQLVAELGGWECHAPLANWSPPKL